MTEQPTREQLRADVELGKDLTGTYYADEDADYYPAMERIFEAAPKLLDQLDQAEAELDSWMARAYEAEKRAWQAEARIKAAQAEAWDEGVDAFDVAHSIDNIEPWGHLRANPYKETT